MSEPIGFCTLCSKTFETFEGLSGCPHCGTEGVPCALKNQVDVNVNVHELRVLCIWAENYANATEGVDPDVVYAIAARLRKQLPEKTCLTMLDEMAGLKQAGIDFETNHPAGDRAKLTG